MDEGRKEVRKEGNIKVRYRERTELGNGIRKGERTEGFREQRNE